MAGPLPVAHPADIRTRLSELAVGQTANAAAAWLLSFVFVLALGFDSGGYWPTAWDWTALMLLFICAVLLILREGVRIGWLEARCRRRCSG